MPCPEFDGLLSAYHDGELSPEQRAQIEAHTRGCPECGAELEMFRRLSELAVAHETEEIVVPKQIWAKIKAQLETPSSEFRPESKNVRVSWRSMLAASVLMLVGTVAGIWAIQSENWHHTPIDLGPFMDSFERSPEVAQQGLLASFKGRDVTLQEAEKELKYRPLAACPLPGEYQLSQAAMLKMPCCKCLEICLRRDDGGMLCLFEHERDQFSQFGDREVASTLCRGKQTRVVTMNHGLAATWQQGQHFLTVVGARDLAEIEDLIDHFGQQPKRIVQ